LSILPGVKALESSSQIELTERTASEMVADYGDGCAEFYDEIYGPPNQHIVRTLANLASNGSVFELGLATGRTAIPLTEHCREVAGIESSRAMLEQLALKDKASRVRAIEADFATTCLDDRFDLIFTLTNTIFLLESTDLMLECFRNVRQMLKMNGLFLIEAFRPYEYKEGRPTIYSHRINTKLGERLYEARLLYQDPEQLDVLASSAGLELRERWSDWNGSAYTSQSTQHVSIYRVAG
jgi:SAM-dependent methyltransferase